VKFTPRTGRIDVRSANEGGELRVDVTDSGIGIDADALPRLFTAFQQADRTITRRFGGLGLGLTISKALVEMHGGTLTAASGGIGKGATFTLRLPTSGGPSRHGPAQASPVATRAGGCRILLVEDHADTLKVMARLLRNAGHAVATAGTVKEALDAANGEQAFDLLISDIGLPDGSGLDVMRELAPRGGTAGIALSGFGTEEDVRRSIEAGFSEHLTKPVNLAQLEAMIRRYAEAKDAT
jgi:CheY-like chemotaxis protein